MVREAYSQAIHALMFAAIRESNIRITPSTLKECENSVIFSKSGEGFLGKWAVRRYAQMKFPKYIQEVLDRSEIYVYTGYNGPNLKGYDPGYVLKIRKYSHRQLMPIFQKNLDGRCAISLRLSWQRSLPSSKGN